MFYFGFYTVFLIAPIPVKTSYQIYRIILKKNKPEINPDL